MISEADDFSLFTLHSSLNIIEFRSIPSCLFRLDGDDAWFHIMYILQVFLEGERDDRHVDFLVDTFGLQTIFQQDIGLMTQVLRYLNGLLAGFI